MDYFCTDHLCRPEDLSTSVANKLKSGMQPVDQSAHFLRGLLMVSMYVCVCACVCVRMICMIAECSLLCSPYFLRRLLIVRMYGVYVCMYAYVYVCVDMHDSMKTKIICTCMYVCMYV
jgi:hypothetical protein